MIATNTACKRTTGVGLFEPMSACRRMSADSSAAFYILRRCAHPQRAHTLHISHEPQRAHTRVLPVAQLVHTRSQACWQTLSGVHRAEATHVQARPRVPEPAAQRRTLRLPRTTNHAQLDVSLTCAQQRQQRAARQRPCGLRAASAAMTLLNQIHRAKLRLQPTPVGTPYRAAWTAPRPGTPLSSCAIRLRPHAP